MGNTLFEMHRKNAIEYWNDCKNGIYQWWDDKRYTTDYCEAQIEYFNNLK